MSLNAPQIVFVFGVLAMLGACKDIPTGQPEDVSPKPFAQGDPENPETKKSEGQRDPENPETKKSETETPPSLSQSLEAEAKKIGTTYLPKPPYVKPGQKMPAFSFEHGAAYLSRDAEGELNFVCAEKNKALFENSFADDIESAEDNDGSGIVYESDSDQYINIPRFTGTLIPECETGTCNADDYEKAELSFHLIYYFAGEGKEKGVKGFFERLVEEGMPLDIAYDDKSYHTMALKPAYTDLESHQLFNLDLKEGKLEFKRDDTHYVFDISEGLNQGMLLENDTSALKLYFNVSSTKDAVLHGILRPRKSEDTSFWIWAIQKQAAIKAQAE